MGDFRQNYKRRKSLFGLLGCLVFIGLGIDAEFVNIAVPAGMRETGPWLYWTMVVVASVGAMGFAWQFLFPPLVLAADLHGITFGYICHSPVINLSIRDFSYKGRADSHIAWDKVRSIGVDEVHYTSSDIRQSEPALRLEFDDSVDLGTCGDMHAMRSVSRAYFAAINRKRTDKWVGYKESQGMRAAQNIVMIGEQHFDENVHQVCDRLRKLAAEFNERDPVCSI